MDMHAWMLAYKCQFMRGKKLHLFAAKAGEVLLVNGDSGSSSSSGSGALGTGTVATAATSTTSTTATTAATGTRATSAGSLNEAHVDLKEVLLLALLLALGLVLLALDVGILLLGTLELLGGGPLLVELGALVGSTDGLGAQVTLGSLLGKVVGVGLGLVGGLLGLLLAGGLGLGLIGLSNVLAGLLIVPGLLAALVTPALVHLLAGVAIQ